MEAEEIMKQLDIEQAKEMPSSTLTSSEGITACHGSAPLPQRLQMSADSTVEDGEIVTESDMPSLTGTTNSDSLRCSHAKACNSLLGNRAQG